MKQHPGPARKATGAATSSTVALRKGTVSVARVLGTAPAEAPHAVSYAVWGWGP